VVAGEVGSANRRTASRMPERFMEYSPDDRIGRAGPPGARLHESLDLGGKGAVVRHNPLEAAPPYLLGTQVAGTLRDIDPLRAGKGGAD